ncbi:MAG: enoyl-CoA hydratase/isomerase family protein [Pseudomonadota bacterium]
MTDTPTFDTLDVSATDAGRAFSAGADLSTFQAADGAQATREAADLGRQMADALEAMRAVSIAGIHGWCVGGGLVLAAACDLRLASESARFSIPEVDLGIPLAWGGINDPECEAARQEYLRQRSRS